MLRTLFKDIKTTTQKYYISGQDEDSKASKVSPGRSHTVAVSAYRSQPKAGSTEEIILQGVDGDVLHKSDEAVDSSSTVDQSSFRNHPVEV